MQPRRQKRLFAVLLVIGLLTGAVAAMLYALQQNIDLFYTPSQLIDGHGEDKKKPVAVKYRNPKDHTQTWSGRGKSPRWLQEMLSQGGKLENFLVK